MQNWKTVSKVMLLDHSQYLKVEDHVVELPDGRQIPNWPWVITRNYVVVVARSKKGQYLCFKQTKYAIEGVTLAPVGGYLEEGEEPLAAAQRELLEETGYQGRQWTNLGSYREDANHGGAMAFLFFADQVEKVCEPNSDDLEEQRLLLLDQQELEDAFCAGAFKNLAWTATVGLSLAALRRMAG